MENLSVKEGNTIKDIKILSKLKKEERDSSAIKGIRNIFRQKKKVKAIKYQIRRDIENLFEHKGEENFYKQVRVNNSWSTNSFEYEGKGDRNKTLSVEEYFKKIIPCLNNIMNNLKKSNTWKIHLTITLFLP